MTQNLVKPGERTGTRDFGSWTSHHLSRWSSSRICGHDGVEWPQHEIPGKERTGAVQQSELDMSFLKQLLDLPSAFPHSKCGFLSQGCDRAFLLSFLLLCLRISSLPCSSSSSSSPPPPPAAAAAPSASASSSASFVVSRWPVGFCVASVDTAAGVRAPHFCVAGVAQKVLRCVVMCCGVRVAAGGVLAGYWWCCGGNSSGGLLVVVI